MLLLLSYFGMFKCMSRFKIGNVLNFIYEMTKTHLSQFLVEICTTCLHIVDILELKFTIYLAAK